MIGCLSSCNPFESKSLAEAGVTEFHTRYNAGDFATIYREAHADLKKVQTEDDFMTFLNQAKLTLGDMDSTSQLTWTANSYNLVTSVVMVQESQFQNGEGQEHFTFVIEDGKPILLGYRIDSQAFMEKAAEAAGGQN